MKLALFFYYYYSLCIEVYKQFDLIITVAMRRLNLTTQIQIIQELQLFCKNMPKICKKTSQLGWTSNDRVVVIRNGYFEYYNHHLGFVQDQMQTLNPQYFKCAIILDKIIEVNFLPKDNKHKNILQIIFDKQKAKFKYEDTNRQPLQNQEQPNVDNKGKQQKWHFQFSYDVKDYIQSKYEKRKQQIRNKFRLQPIQPDDLVRILFEQNNNSNKTKYQQPKEKKTAQQDIQQYAISLQKTKSIIKAKVQKQRQEAEREKRKKEKQILQMQILQKNQSFSNKFAISSFWRQYYKNYQNMAKKNLLKRQHPSMIQQKIQLQLHFLSQISYFNNSASKLVKQYINQYMIGHQDRQRKQFQGFSYYKGLWIKIGDKELNQEFMVNYYLNDILYLIKDVKGIKINLPLMSLMKYKGVKALIMCDMPCSQLQKTQVYNLFSQTVDLQLVAKLKESLQVLQDILNIKSQPFEVNPKKKLSAPLGIHLKIYEYSVKKDKSQDITSLPDFYYLINIGKIFPLDYQFQKKSLSYYSRLRPQIVAFYRDYYNKQDSQLLVQAFMQSSMPQDFKKYQDDKAIQACNLIKSYWIPHLLDKIDKIQILFVDSYSIKCIMQEMGINIRYLYKIYEKTKLPYIKEIILAQVLARTIKKQFRKVLKDLKQQTKFIDERELKSLSSQNHEAQNYIRQKIKQGQIIYNQFALDYLNLIFGSGIQSKEFWKIISAKCKNYFNIESSYPPLVNPGCLLNAVLWHCGLTVQFNHKIPLFKSENPFYNHLIEFQQKIRTFDFPSLSIHKLFRSAPSFQDKIDLQLFMQSSSNLLKMQILFGKTIGHDWSTQVAIAKLSNYKQYLLKPKYKNIYHPIHLPYYFVNKSQQNFHHALQILNFSLPETHPLLISFYIEYMNLFEQDLMVKTIILLAVKSLGQFHLKTTELYTKFYHKGYKQYHLQAKRAKNIEQKYQIIQEMYDNKMYESCIEFSMKQLQTLRQNENKIGTGNYLILINLLMIGLEATLNTMQYEKGITISKYLSDIISSFKHKDNQLQFQLFKNIVAIHLLKQKKKFFIYKMILLAVTIRQQKQKIVLDKDDMLRPCSGATKDQIILGLSTQYYEHQNHSNWIAFIFKCIQKSFQYFNFLQDLFTNYQYHLKRYNSDEFKKCLGYLDLLVYLYGQRFFKTLLYSNQ